MTPKETAISLVDKYRNEITRGLVFTDDFNPERERRYVERAKACAIICCNEMINEVGDGHGRKTFWISIKKQVALL